MHNTSALAKLNAVAISAINSTCAFSCCDVSKVSAMNQVRLVVV